MPSEFIHVNKTAEITTITLNRPEKFNALHTPLIIALQDALNTSANDHSRVVIIHGNGEHFCAGGDIAWMQKIALQSAETNYADAKILADLLYQLYHFPKPTLVLAHGMTLGGGLGLIAAADIAIATKEATFALPEVKIGIAPSMISPYIVTAIGERASRYYALTGERFGAEEAHRLGLIHRITNHNELMSVGLSLAQTLLKYSQNAMQAVKQLLLQVANKSIDETLKQKTAQHLADLRATPEAQKKFLAYLQRQGT